MVAPKSRVGPMLRQDDGLAVRETLLRVEPRVDLYIREKWLPGREERLPVILLHGAGMDGSGWDVPLEDVSLVDTLARRGSRTVAFDFRGHGRSSRAADGWSVTVRTSVADTVAVLDYVQEVTGSSHAVLIGESFGSIVAPVVAEQAPQRVAGVVLLGLIHASIPISIDDLLAGIGEAPAGYAFTTEEEWPELFIPTASPAVMAWHQAQFGTAFAYPVGPYADIGNLPHTRSPGRIGGHILAVTGDLDPFASLDDTRAFLAAVGSDKVEHLYQEGVGHIPYVERKAEEVQVAVNALVDRATADRPATSAR